MDYKNQNYGKKVVRRNYSKLPFDIPLPDLIQIQKDSYQKFINEDIQYLLEAASPIISANGQFEWYFTKPYLEPGKYAKLEAKSRDVNYSSKLYCEILLKDNSTGEIKTDRVMLTDLPKMTEEGTFIINGAERVVVTQIVRSSGVYFSEVFDKKHLDRRFAGQIIPTRGAWIEFVQGAKDFFVEVDRSKKIPFLVLINALGLTSVRKILDLFGKNSTIKAILETKEGNMTANQALASLYTKIKNGEKASEEQSRAFIQSRFFDVTRYDLQAVGRFKFNQKLDVFERALNLYLAKDIINPQTGELILAKDSLIDEDVVNTFKANPIMRSYLREIAVKEIDSLEYDPTIEVIRIDDLTGEVITNDIYVEILDVYAKDDLGRKQTEHRIIGSDQRENRLYVTSSDIIASISYYFNLYEEVEIDGKPNNIGKTDDIDHLGNRRVRLIGELLSGHLRGALMKVSKTIIDKMSTTSQQTDVKQLFTSSPISSAIKNFFGSSQLSQFMDQINPLAELTQKRRVSALGPGGISRDRAGVEVRDVHNSHYGRLCPIETPEGPSIGLISSLASYARVNELGFITTPFLRVDKMTGSVDVSKVHYLTANEERTEVIAAADSPLNDQKQFIHDEVVARENGETNLYSKNEITYMEVSPKQLVSVGTATIPFLEHDDASRALMGANMQRQAVPLLMPSSPIVGTGIEHRAAKDSCAMVIAEQSGYIVYTEATYITLIAQPLEDVIVNGELIYAVGSTFDYHAAKTIFEAITHDWLKRGEHLVIDYLKLPDYEQITLQHVIRFLAHKTENAPACLHSYILAGMMRSNQDSLIAQRPIVIPGEYVEKGDVLADGPSTEKGELALGRNVTVAFMTWEGYNYEDAIIMSEDLVTHDIFTSVHIEKYQVETRDIKGEAAKDKTREKITREVPSAPRSLIDKLDENGIIVPGSEVESGDILVGKVTPRGGEGFSAEDKLMIAIIGEKARDYRDSSLRVPHGGGGIVQSVKHYYRTSKNEAQPEGTEPGDFLTGEVNEQIRVYVAQKRKITEGDKMAGRHGNKGVISKILPREDMPYLPDGTPIDIMLNPLGVPSRMNIGQILEIHLGLAARKLGIKVATPVFDGVNENDLNDIIKESKTPAELALIEAGQKDDGKTVLYDGRTGEPFDSRISVGVMYMIKLSHMVEDKLHARNVGPYSLVTQQPMGGKAQNGGQRFGEMEVWAMYAYGAAYTLRELLTIKSDDYINRDIAHTAITGGHQLPEGSVPESFKVLTRELQALGLYVELIDAKDGSNEILKSVVDAKKGRIRR